MTIKLFSRNLRRPLYVGLLALLSACNASAPVETTVKAYWAALAQGDIDAAYSHLSEADKAYLDVESFRGYVLEQPSMRFLLLSLSEEPAPPKQRWGKQKKSGDSSSVQVNILNTKLSGSHARLELNVELPDLSRVLSQGAVAEAQSSQEEELRAETRLLRQLARPVERLPQTRYSHAHTLVREKGEWHIEVAHYRARAMFAQAQTLSANRDLQGAHTLLQTLAQLPAAAQLNLVQAARRGRRILPYLHRLEFNDFKQVAAPGCPDAATVQVDNTGEFPVETLEAVVEFRNGQEVLARQRVALGNPDSLIRPGVQTPFELCLEPPRNWGGQANVWASWLEFPEDVYKQQIR